MSGTPTIKRRDWSTLVVRTVTQLFRRIICLLLRCPPTTVAVLRHADIDLPPAGSDPDLNPAGQARAQALRHHLGDAGVDAVYATEFQRTQQTAQPLAAHAGLSVQIRDALDVDALAAEILHHHLGHTVVVVSHSNVVPQIVAALGASAAVTIAEDEFDHLLWVTLPAVSRNHVHHLRYGAEQ